MQLISQDETATLPGDVEVAAPAAEADLPPLDWGADPIEPGTLPPLEYMRGYLQATGGIEFGVVVDREMRRWFDLLIGEVGHLRAELADMQVSARIERWGLTETEVTMYRYLRNTMMSTAEIASDLYVSVNTVKTHTKNVYRKTGVAKRLQLRQLPRI